MFQKKSDSHSDDCFRPTERKEGLMSRRREGAHVRVKHNDSQMTRAGVGSVVRREGEETVMRISWASQWEVVMGGKTPPTQSHLHTHTHTEGKILHTEHNNGHNNIV